MSLSYMLKGIMTVVTFRPSRQGYKSEAGFSLLETLIALAILSFVSLTLFQSSATLLSVSDRAVKSGERTLDGALNRLAFARVIDGIVPHWPEHADTAFIGSKTKMSGISTENLNSETGTLTPFTLQITQTGDEASLDNASLIYTTDALSWPMDVKLPRNAHFSFLARDQQWYDKWPLDKMAGTGFSVDDPFLQAQPIPLAISIQDANNQVYWMAEIRHHRALPARFKFSVGN